MYTTYFGLKEKPFRLVPDPGFLFLSASHEEALAHLSYAVSQQEGFAEVTGEVGTGKTTLCRSFLESLGPDVETAFIFNSRLDARQMLNAILAELAIECTAKDTAQMTQALYLFLLEKKTQGKTVVLLIDEAQNLTRETLEQLRLLSNLETTRNKLLLIILVGQPELSELLNSHDMRQLRQRINLSCHISPLDRQETSQYIRHRINKACVHVRPLFSPGAENLIYRYSKGIPRLINILCDRALVAAFSLDQKNVTADLVKTAFKEVNAGKRRIGFRGAQGRFPMVSALFSLVCVGCLAAGLFYFFPVNGLPGNLLWIFPERFGNSSGKLTEDFVSQNTLTLPGADFGTAIVNDVSLEQPKKYPGAMSRQTILVPNPGEACEPVPVLSGGKEISSYLAQTVSRAPGKMY